MKANPGLLRTHSMKRLYLCVVKKVGGKSSYSLPVLRARIVEGQGS